MLTQVKDGLEAVNAFGGIATAVGALFVYIEARRIRRIEWFTRTAENWTRFNEMILTHDPQGRWRQMLAGQLGWDQLEQRDKMLLYTYLNVLVFELQASTRRVLDRSYAEKSIADNLRQLSPLMPGMLEHLRSDGWPADFVAVVERTLGSA